MRRISLYVRGQKTVPFMALMNNGRSVFRSRKLRASARGASLLALVFFSAVCATQAQNFKGKPQREVITAGPQDSLRAQETLEYSVEWLGIPVGKIILKTEEIVAIDNRKCYHLSAVSFPNSFLRHLYDLEYQVDTYIDVETLYPRRFTKTRRINKKVNYVVIDFYQRQKKATYKSWGTSDYINISRSRGEMSIKPTADIPEGTQDLLSSFYYFRLLKIDKGRSYPLNVYYQQTNWQISMNVEKFFLRELRKKGTLETIAVSITSSLNDFILGKHKFLVYLTADSRRIPLEFKVGTAMGPIHGIIQKLPE